MTDGPVTRRGRGQDDDAHDRDLGMRVVARLQGLIRAARMYDASNQTYQRQVDEMLAVLAGALEDETVLVGLGDSFYLNGVRLRPSSSTIALFRALHEELHIRGLAAVRFQRGVTRDEMTGFLGLFNAARTAEQGQALPDAVTAAGIHRIQPLRTTDLRAEDTGEGGGGGAEETEDTRGERARAREIVQRTTAGTRDILLKTARTGRPALRQARRLIQPVVDCITRDEVSIVGLTALKDHDEYTFAHSVNVSILSIAMGQALGLPRGVLANLGVAALLHDLGKINVPAEVLRKPGRLDEEEWEHIRRHPLEGVKITSRMPGLNLLMLDTMRVSFEHHRTLDGGGYPRVAAPRPLSPLSRVVAVADVFDALTAHRAYRKRAFTGFEALRMLTGPDRDRYDEAALWALMRSVGLYPAGTLLRTASGHVVVSLSPNTRDLARPHCRVLERPDRTRVPDDTPETWEPMPAHDSVVRVLSPEDWPGDTEALLAA
jgi:HD-GYP domain-containing protein (c-di-GMP phosphodiesterase class II)